MGFDALFDTVAIHRIGITSDAIAHVFPASFAVLLGAIGSDFGHGQDCTGHVVQDQAGANLARVELGARVATFEAAWIGFSYRIG